MEDNMCRTMFSKTSQNLFKTFFPKLFSSFDMSKLGTRINSKVASNTTIPAVLDHCIKPAKHKRWPIADIFIIYPKFLVLYRAPNKNTYCLLLIKYRV